MDREIVSLRIISDFTFDKIAQMLDLPLGTVQWKYYKALHYVKASIANLASYIIAISLIQAVKLSSKTSDSTSVSEEKDTESIPSKGDSEWGDGVFEEGDASGTSEWSGRLDDVMSSSTFKSASDSTGTASSVQSVTQSFLTVIMVLLTILFVIIALTILSMKKVKMSKKK